MSVAVESQQGYDVGDVPLIARSAIKLGLLQAILVFAFSLVSRYLSGVTELVLESVLLVIGLAAVSGLPGLWTKARTGDGIAAAAGIGLAATVVFLAADVAVLQPLGTYTNRWLEIGGGSNWWYHPVWWMVGTFLPWMGAVVLANQVAKSGSASIPGMMTIATVFALVCGIIAVVIGFPGASWNLATFGIAFLPGIALAALFSTMGRRRA